MTIPGISHVLGYIKTNAKLTADRDRAEAAHASLLRVRRRQTEALDKHRANLKALLKDVECVKANLDVVANDVKANLDGVANDIRGYIRSLELEK